MLHNNKLYSILLEFDRYEQNRCRKYIQSPYFNRSQALCDLFEVLISNINAKEPVELSKELIWQKMHENKDFDDARYRKYFSDLLKLVEGFLAQEIYEKDSVSKVTNLIESVGSRGFERMYNSTLKTAERTALNFPYKNADYYYGIYAVEKKNYNLQNYDRKRAQVSNIEKIVDNLDYFYYSEKLKYYCAVLSRQTSVSHEYELSFVSEIIDFLRNKSHDNIPAVVVYYQICLALIEGEQTSHYFKLKKLLSEYSLEFPKMEAANIYTYAINYCTRKINTGHFDFYKEYFDLYKELLNKKIIIVDNELDVGHFKNIITIGLRVGEIVWVEDFIYSYKDFLPEAQKENAVTFNLALVFFEKKEYGKVLSFLQTTNYEDFVYNLNAKTLLLKTYFEMDELEPLLALSDSFRAYLYRHKNISPIWRKSYNNLIKFTKKMSKILSRDSESLAKLKEEIKNEQKVVSRSWLLEKITALEK